MAKRYTTFELDYNFALSNLNSFETNLINEMVNACKSADGVLDVIKCTPISLDVMWDSDTTTEDGIKNSVSKAIVEKLGMQSVKRPLFITHQNADYDPSKPQFVDTYVDIAVCIDGFGNMQSFIKRAFSDLGSLIGKIERTYNPEGEKNLSIKLRFIVFGGEMNIIRTPFMDMKKQIYDVQASHDYMKPAKGSKSALSALSALDIAMNSPFTYNSERIVLLFTDALFTEADRTTRLPVSFEALKKSREIMRQNGGASNNVFLFTASDEINGFVSRLGGVNAVKVEVDSGLEGVNIDSFAAYLQNAGATSSAPKSDETTRPSSKADDVPDSTPLSQASPASKRSDAPAPDAAKPHVEARSSGESENIKSIMDRSEKMRVELSKRIVGQQHAVTAFVEEYFGAELFAIPSEKRKGPKSLFLFAGPPGVGKTMLAESAAELSGKPFLRVDMSEYADKESVCNFNGIHPSYKSACAGQVTSFVKQNPDCILLFDEVEKACINVLQLFLQVLDRGMLRDIFLDEEISFTDSTIIMTTNAGRNIYEDYTRTNLSNISDKAVMNALKTDINPITQVPYFPAAIVSRLAKGRIVMFNHLEPYALCEIISNEIKSQIKRFESVHHFDVSFDERVVSTALLYAGGGASDARSLKGAAKAFVVRELLDLFNRYSVGAVSSDVSTLKKLRIALDLDSASEEARALFINPKALNVLVFCDEEKSKTILSRENENINFICTSDLERAKSLVRGDISFVIVDPMCAVKSSESMPSDIEDIESDGMTFYRYAIEYFVELPIYVMGDRKLTRGDSDGIYISLLRGGAKGVVPFSPDNVSEFYEKVDTLRTNVMMSNGAYKLARSNKVLSFNCAQLFSRDGTQAEIRMQRMVLKRAVSAEDNSSILSVTMRPNVKFSDVIGAADAKDSLKEFIKYLMNPAEYLAKGVRAPRGVLLYGSPGTGKTLLAKAVAGEADVAFIQKNGTEFFKSYVGEGPKAIRDMFRMARRYAPAIIFIDEIDTFAKMRTGGEMGRAGEELLNTFLSEMDGFTFDEKRPVFVLAATNYGIDQSSGDSRVLDPAFVRRFDRKIKIELPSSKEREEFIRYYLAKHGVNTISDEAIANLALRSYGRSPADLEMVVEFAIRDAQGAELTDEILGKALDADRYGEERAWDIETVRQTTYHEAGHTVISRICGKKPTYVTNISRGNYGGYMLSEIDDNKFGNTKSELLDEICCCLGGRAAEIVFYGDEVGMSTGASGDLRSATAIARDIICTYGMENEIGLAVSRGDEFGGEVSKKVYDKINDILKAQFERAVKLIRDNREAIEKLVSSLMEKNSLTAVEIEEILSPYIK